MVRPFRPARWLPGGHAQTLGARLLRSRRAVSYRRERLTTPDGDFLDLDFAEPAPGAAPAGDGPPPETDPAEAPPRVVLLHGLEGCSSSGYMRETCRALAGRGLRPVAVNFRSRSGEPNRRPESYHAGKSDDLALVLDRLLERDPGSTLGAVGFSLGGNVLLKYLAERGEEARRRLRAAVVVSVPFDLALSADRMERGLGRIYTRHFLRSLRAMLRAKARRFPCASDLRRGLAARTIREFDDAVTAPLHGFRDAEHYYRSSSSAGRLEAIRVPTLVMHALDDPLVPAEAVPLAAIRANPWLLDALTAKGGHVGFVSRGGPRRPRLWAESEAARFLATALRRPAVTGEREPAPQGDGGAG